MKRKRRANQKKNDISSIEVDMSWVKPGVNVLLDSGDDEKPYVAKVQDIDTATEQVKVKRTPQKTPKSITKISIALVYSTHADVSIDRWIRVRTDV